MVNMKDVWNIDMVGRTSAERTGYATQKPEALLERILTAGSREGDICADFFCGSGTLGAAAGKLGRRWICCDDGSLAVAAAMKRLSKKGQSMKVIREVSGTVAVAPRDCGRLRVSAFCTPTLFKEKISFTIELKGYNLETTQTDVLRASEGDCLAPVDFWSVDTDFDGVVFRPDSGAAFYRDKKGFCTQMNLEIPAESAANRKIAVRAVDILGNISYAIIDGGKIFEQG